MLGQKQRGSDGRQRTIHDLVEWFEAGGATRLRATHGKATAESVCTVDDGPMSVVGYVTSLVDKSMVVLVDPGSFTIPAAGAAAPLRARSSAQPGRLEETEDRHLTWFLDLAERGALGLDSPDEAAWSAERDYANLRAAHLTALATMMHVQYPRLVAALSARVRISSRQEITSWADASTALEAAQGNSGRATSAYGRFATAVTCRTPSTHASSARHLGRFRPFGK